MARTKHGRSDIVLLLAAAILWPPLSSLTWQRHVTSGRIYFDQTTFILCQRTRDGMAIT
jgi:hypothetical protein